MLRNGRISKIEIRSNYFVGKASPGLPAADRQRSASQRAETHGQLDHRERQEEYHRQAGGGCQAGPLSSCPSSPPLLTPTVRSAVSPHPALATPKGFRNKVLLSS